MNSQHILADRAALDRNRRRACADGMFLQNSAANEINDRLAMVKRSFTKPAVVCGFPELWSQRLRDATIVSDNETLDIESGAHDLVIHALGLHWSNDPVGQLIQCRRALLPDGLMIAACFGGQTLHELRACLAQAETEISGGLSPRVAPMAELRELGGLLQRAGFALPVADAQPMNVEYSDAWHLMRDLRNMGESNALFARLKRPTRRAVLEHATNLYQSHFGTADGRVTATFEIIFLTGWAHADSQPKPLRPGSAQQRLADVLRTTETPLND